MPAVLTISNCANEFSAKFVGNLPLSVKPSFEKPFKILLLVMLSKWQTLVIRRINLMYKDCD